MSKTTNNHKVIRDWVEKRCGRPSAVVNTGKKNDPGILRIDFPDGPEPSLQEISWEDFFDKFDRANLSFVYQEETESGEKSRFCKFIEREDASRSSRSR